MKFTRDGEAGAVRSIAGRICKGLHEGKHVVWLISGGSNIAPELAVMQLIKKQAGDALSSLAIIPIDERYGKAGHADSNTQQLRVAGFDPGAATWVDVLARNLSFAETVDFYNDATRVSLENAAVIIGQIGLGNDGHIAGILPGSPAIEALDKVVIGYEWDDYMRMTLTPSALRKVQIAYVLAYGESKAGPLKRLYENNEAFAELPAKLLYEIPEVRIYNNVITSEG